MNLRQAKRSAAPLVRWEFERNQRHLMCSIRATAASSSFEVATVPLWNGGRTTVETFASPRAALHRHAAIATDLRSSGWTVAAYTE